MSETECQSSEQRAKICQLSIWALLLSILGVFTFGVTSVIGLILAVIADRKICKSKGKLRGRVYTTLAMVTAIVFLGRMIIPDRSMRRVPCPIHLTLLGKEIVEYADDFGGQYPVPDKWCDSLVRHSKVREIIFVCPSAEKGRCHYAINPHCKKNSPGDIVLLFETKGGWNRFGGPELLTTENHKGEGCNVLFNDMHAEFVKAERLSELKWDTGKKDSESIE